MVEIKFYPYFTDETFDNRNIFFSILCQIKIHVHNAVWTELGYQNKRRVQQHERALLEIDFQAASNIWFRWSVPSQNAQTIYTAISKPWARAIISSAVRQNLLLMVQNGIKINHLLQINQQSGINKCLYITQHKIYNMQ